MHDAKDRRVRTNPKGKREYREDSERRRSAELPVGEANVLPPGAGRCAEAGAPSVPCRAAIGVVAEISAIAEASERLGLRFVLAHTKRAQLVDAQIQMQADFVIEILDDSLARRWEGESKETPNTARQLREGWTHHAGSITLLTAEAYRFHVATSARMSCRPRGVRE